MSPKITGASVSGKKLFVSGQDFDEGSVIVLEGEDQKTANDDQAPAMLLIAKKAGKKIPPGQAVRLRVRNPNGSLSPEFIFTRASD